MTYENDKEEKSSLSLVSLQRLAGPVPLLLPLLFWNPSTSLCPMLPGVSFSWLQRHLFVIDFIFKIIFFFPFHNLIGPWTLPLYLDQNCGPSVSLHLLFLCSSVWIEYVFLLSGPLLDEAQMSTCSDPITYPAAPYSSVSVLEALYT